MFATFIWETAACPVLVATDKKNHWTTDFELWIPSDPVHVVQTGNTWNALSKRDVKIACLSWSQKSKK